MTLTKLLGLISIAIFIVVGVLSVTAQNELAATLEVLTPGVTVQRVNTSQFIAVEAEAIVGVGDIIRTDAGGSARITFFEDGTDVTLQPNTRYRITEFTGDDKDFQLITEVLVGQTTQRLNRVLSANSRYDVTTPGMTLAAKGTVFNIRVEESGRAGMLVNEGVVASSAGEDTASVPAAYGIRATANEGLSEVVLASTFEQLDAALDGCVATVSTVDDVSINVRTGPSIEQEQLGVVAASDIVTFYGINTDNNWYRISYGDGYGWILSSNANVDATCAGLRIFENNYTEGDSVNIPLMDDAVTPESTEEPATEANDTTNP